MAKLEEDRYASGFGVRSYGNYSLVGYRPKPEELRPYLDASAKNNGWVFREPDSQTSQGFTLYGNIYTPDFAYSLRESRIGLAVFSADGSRLNGDSIYSDAREVVSEMCRALNELQCYEAESLLSNCGS